MWGSHWLLALSPGCLGTQLGGAQMHRAAQSGSARSSVACTRQCGERRSIAPLCATGSKVSCRAERCSCHFGVSCCIAGQAFSANSSVGAGMQQQGAVWVPAVQSPLRAFPTLSGSLCHDKNPNYVCAIAGTWAAVPAHRRVLYVRKLPGPPSPPTFRRTRTGAAPPPLPAGIAAGRAGPRSPRSARSRRSARSSAPDSPRGPRRPPPPGRVAPSVGKQRSVRAERPAQLHFWECRCC